MMPEPAGWGFWPLLALLGMVLAMDENSLAQTWLSQPLPAGILAGLLAGDPATGALLGTLMQMVVIGNFPVGASFCLDTGSAVLGVSAGAITAGWRPSPDLAATMAGAGDGAERLGWLLALMALASLAGGQLVSREHRWRLGWMLDGYRSVRDGDLGRLEGLHRRALLTTALRGAVLTVGWTLVVRLIWPLDLQAAPAPLRGGLALLPLLIPALAAGTLLERFGHRRALPWVATVALVMVLTHRFLT
jgi:mannose/fructose/N-acetylgalactosamine-specific phosphotransferase system component IIC